MDRESDCVAFMRELDKNNELFLLRVKKNASVYYLKEEESIKQGELANKLSLGKFVKTIKYKKKKVKIYVNECDVEVRRDATKTIINEKGKKSIKSSNSNSP